MMQRRLYVWALATASLASLTSLTAQTPRNIPFASETFFSYSPVTAPAIPQGTQFQLTFPGQAGGSQLVPAACSTYAALQYAHYSWDGASWTGPVTGPVYAGSPTTFYATTAATTGWIGVRANFSMTGVLGSASSPSTQAFVQAIFVSQDRCYEYGPEFGFYRTLQNPGNTTEQNTVYFYYSLNSNCYVLSGVGSCRDKNTGIALIPNTVSVPITINGPNSQGGSNFIFDAYLTSATNWRITVTDPYTNSLLQTFSSAIDPAGFYGQIAASMYSQGLTGYVSSTQQRVSALGGITDSVSSPLKLTVYSISELTSAQQVSTGPTPPSSPTYARINGNCEQGNGRVVTSGVTSSIANLVMRSYPLCTLTVYNAGTTNPATIFNDGIGTPKANPFTADGSGHWFFYGPNGSYDVQLSGGGLPRPFTLGDIPIFDQRAWRPNQLFAYGTGAGSLSGVMAVYNGADQFYQGFTANPSVTTSTLWHFPTGSGVGCWFDDGAGNLSVYNCIPPPQVTPSGIPGSIQYNNTSFGGDGNFTWDKTGQTMKVIGFPGTPGLRVEGGAFALSYGGYVSALNSWAGFNSNTDGAMLRGLNIAPTTTGSNTGGYLNIGPLGYGDTPAPLNGLSSFGLHTALLWVSGANNATPDTTYGLNTNLYISAAGGLATTNTLWNSIQAPNGGITAKSLTAAYYTNLGGSNGAPGVTSGDSFNPGAIYWDTGAGGLRVYNGVAWVPVGTGGGGGGGGAGGAAFPPTSVQFNTGGILSGSFNFYWQNANRLLVISALDAAHAGIAIQTGFAQADGGFLATTATATNYNSIQAPGGGMHAIGYTADRYMQTGQSAGAPGMLTGGSLAAGTIYWDTGDNQEKLYDGSAWISLVGGGGSTTPGGATTNVQFNSSGSFGGSSNFTFASQLLTVRALDASHPGVFVGTGYIQSDQGFLATMGVATNYNSIQAPSGGMAALSFTAGSYVQTGVVSGTGPPFPSDSDSFHPGAMFWSIGNACEEVYNGSTWNCIGGGGGVGGTGVFSLNGLAGAVSIVGTANQVTVSPSGAAVTLGTPQDIADTSSVTFKNVTALDTTGVGTFVAGESGHPGTFFAWTTTGAQVTFQNQNGNFQVDGAGNINGGGALIMGGAVAAYAYYVHGLIVIDTLTNWVGGRIVFPATLSSPQLDATHLGSALNVNGSTIGNGDIVFNPGAVAGNASVLINASRADQPGLIIKNVAGATTNEAFSIYDSAGTLVFGVVGSGDAVVPNAVATHSIYPISPSGTNHLGGSTARWADIWSQTMNLSGDATISGNLSAATYRLSTSRPLPFGATTIIDNFGQLFTPVSTEWLVSIADSPLPVCTFGNEACIYSDSTTHLLRFNSNGGAWLTVSGYGNQQAVGGTTGVVYQNPFYKSMSQTVCLIAGSGFNAYITVYTGATNPPSTQVATMTVANALTGCASFNVLPLNYYLVTATGASIQTWTEWH